MIEQILGLGAQVGGSVIGHKNAKKNRDAQRKENELNRNFSREQYNTQRTHALQDWERQNEYNHPLQQMQRLREAGLNPNLVYGKGADNTAAMIRGGQQNKVQTNAPQYDINAAMSPVLTAANLRAIAAQTDKTNDERKVLQQDALLKAAETIKKLAEGKRTKFDYDLANELRDITIDKAKTDLALTTNKDTLMNTQIKKMREEIELIKQKKLTEIENTELRKFEAQLADDGLTKNDPAWARAILTFMKNNFNIKISDILGL